METEMKVALFKEPLLKNTHKLHAKDKLTQGPSLQQRSWLGAQGEEVKV